MKRLVTRKNLYLNLSNKREKYILKTLFLVQDQIMIYNDVKFGNVREFTSTLKFNRNYTFIKIFCIFLHVHRRG